MPEALVSLSTLSRNVAALQARCPPGTKMLAAVKADAYGHGAVAVARHLASVGVAWLGVATAAEAFELRDAGISSPILIFSPVYHQLPALIDQDIALSAVDLASAEKITLAAKKVGKRARVHLKVDTGMGRLGQTPALSLATAQYLDDASEAHLEGIWTHFACADEPARGFTHGQLERFVAFQDALKAHHIVPELVHAANSAAIISEPQSHFDMVRPGIALYGYHASSFIAQQAPEITPVMTLTAPITFIKKVKAGTAISYGAHWLAPQDTRVATVRIGYADGYPRALSNQGVCVQLNSGPCPVVGNICMDQIMVDLAGRGAEVGDRVTLFGPHGPSGEALAGRVGTIGYELLTGLNKRVRRVYLT